MQAYSKPDYWSQKAHKEGYPARSVYKLEEMDKKFGLVKSGKGADFRVLDLGAAPGSWSLYVLRKLAGSGFLAAADLSPLSRASDQGLFDGENFFFTQGDIYEEETRELLAARGSYHLLISDLAPATSGNRSLDTLRSLALVEEVVNYAETCLAPGGKLVVKIFQGGQIQEVQKRIKSLFAVSRSFKPEACRSASFETYLVGQDRKKG